MVVGLSVRKTSVNVIWERFCKKQASGVVLSHAGQRLIIEMLSKLLEFIFLPID
jgi:hypothetical protein